MRRLSLLLGLGAVVSSAFFVVPAFAADSGRTTCNGTLAPGTYHRVVVPEDGVCLSDGPVSIRGGVFVMQGATLVFASDESPVPGEPSSTSAAGRPSTASRKRPSSSSSRSRPMTS